MKNSANKILEDAKDALKESIIIENKIIEEKLLSIIINSKQLLNELENPKNLKKKKKKDIKILEENEIKKVKRKIPLWLTKQSQYNYKILKTYMDLSQNGKHTISVISLERFSGIKESKKFLGHYNQLKTISEKNHAKVFEEKNDQINLWEPVKDFIVQQFEK